MILLHFLCLANVVDDNILVVVNNREHADVLENIVQNFLLPAIEFRDELENSMLDEFSRHVIASHVVFVRNEESKKSEDFSA